MLPELRGRHVLNKHMRTHVLYPYSTQTRQLSTKPLVLCCYGVIRGLPTCAVLCCPMNAERDALVAIMHACFLGNTNMHELVCLQAPAGGSLPQEQC